MRAPAGFSGIFRQDPRACAAYAEGAGIYRIIPAAVAIPRSKQDLIALVRWAAAAGQQLIPRGAASAMGGGNVGDGVVVDLNALEPRLLEIDPARRSARTSANVRLQALNDEAAPHGLRLPPDPSSAGWATLGGMVSTNAAGARSVKYGSVRRWVRGIEMVTADGEVGWIGRGGGVEGRKPEAEVRFAATVAARIRASADLIRQRFPRTRKNSSGYALDAYLDSGDLVDLLIGAEGTLGIITTIEWQLDPIPRHRAGLRATLGDLDDLPRVVPALLRLEPSALEVLDRTFLDLVGSSRRQIEMPRLPAGAQAVLLVEFEGEDDALLRGVVDDAVHALEPWATEVETALTEKDEHRLWSLRHAASPILAGLPETRRSMQVIEDGCVPVPRLGEYIQFIRRAAETAGLNVVIFGHAGDGNIHVNLLPELDRTGWEQAVAGLLESVTAEVIRLGGTPTGEHGDGRLRAGFLARLYGPDITGLFQAIKSSFDPRAILNPGIIVPVGGGFEPVSRLKTGTTAAVVPADIAGALREIERVGGYARPRLEIADG